MAILERQALAHGFSRYGEVPTGSFSGVLATLVAFAFLALATAWSPPAVADNDAMVRGSPLAPMPRVPACWREIAGGTGPGRPGMTCR